MSGTAHQGSYNHRGAAQGPPWAAGSGWGQPWAGPWDPWSLPKPVLIAAVVLGFILWWPLGLALLFFMLGSGRLGCRWARRYGMQPGFAQGGSPPWGGGRRNGCRGGNTSAPSSGNRAFDEYREETLRRLEEEQREFAAFLDRLRVAKDKAEFDQFMTERRQRPPTPPEPSQG
jgi:Protein of unknown function (DUF2852)